MRPSPALALAFVALVASVSGVAMAAIPAKDGDVHACYSPTTGAIELVNTQKDNFDCQKSWKGLIIDSTPTHLVSPNGQFTVEATNSGARMTGPGGSVEINSAQVTISGPSKVEIKSAGVVQIRGTQIRDNKQR
jgi:hypothetical protein